MTLPINADYIFEVPSVSQPHLSDDGSVLAFVKTTIDRATMERKARIIVSRRPSDELSALTDGPTDTAPAIDTDRVFFLRPDDDDKKQVWAVPLQRGRGEAYYRPSGRCGRVLPFTERRQNRGRFARRPRRIG